MCNEDDLAERERCDDLGDLKETVARGMSFRQILELPV